MENKLIDLREILSSKRYKIFFSQIFKICVRKNQHKIFKLKPGQFLNENLSYVTILIIQCSHETTLISNVNCTQTINPRD